MLSNTEQNGAKGQETHDERQMSTLRNFAGPILKHLENNPRLTDLVVNDDGQVWLNEAGATGWRSVGHVKTSQIKAILRAVAAIREITFNHEHPILETTFPIGESRIEGLIPPVVKNAALAIRTRSQKIYTLGDYEEAGILSSKSDALNYENVIDDFAADVDGMSHTQVLQAAIRQHRNILCVGGTGTGKTTFLNALIECMSRATPNDRLVIIEDTPELQCAVPNHLFLLATSKVPQSDCLRASLRLKPDRILVGEVRSSDPAQVLLESWNTGHSGGLATIHANDAKGGLYRLEELLRSPSARNEIVRAVQVVVFIDTTSALPAGRKIRQVLVVRGLTPAGDYDVCLV